MFPSGPWTVLPDWHLPRLRRRIDAVVLMPRAIVACTVRAGRRHSARDRDAAEDAALDLHDFHAGSRLHPVVPLLVTLDAARNTAARPLMLPGVTPVLEANAATLEATLQDIASAAAWGPTLATADWQEAPYRPVPSLIEAARMLYARHGVADIRTAHADAHNLGATRAAITRAVADAAATRQPTILFVTGIPGAGKTLCGLDTAFAGQAAFLTGNPSLVHVLREALARDSGLSLRAARQRMEGVIQALPAFRDCYAAGGMPPERVVVIDEAQRCWSAAHARGKTAARPVPLTDSEPALLLDIMARRTDGPVILCLIGTGQEIHDGEGGLAEWGDALRTRPGWQVAAAPGATTAPAARHRLPALPNRVVDAALHLDTPVRSLRSAAAPAWVDAVLAGDAVTARELARNGVPFSVTRDLPVLRARLRRACRGTRRAGLLCSSGARRLRAEGLGRDAAARRSRGGSPLVPRPVSGRARLRRAGGGGHRVLRPRAGAGCRRTVLGRRPGVGRGGVAGAGVPRHRLDPAARRGQVPEQAQRLPRAPDAGALRDGDLGAAGDAADPTRDPAVLDRVADYLLSCGAHRVGGGR